MLVINMKCPRCNGSGEIESNQPLPGDGPYDPMPVPCHKCDGAGYLDAGMIDCDLEDKLDDILDKCNDIKEKCDEIFDKVK